MISACVWQQLSPGVCKLTLKPDMAYFTDNRSSHLWLVQMFLYKDYFVNAILFFFFFFFFFLCYYQNVLDLLSDWMKWLLNIIIGAKRRNTCNSKRSSRTTFASFGIHNFWLHRIFSLSASNWKEQNCRVSKSNQLSLLSRSGNS